MKKIIYLSLVICACVACISCSPKDKNDHAICRLYYFSFSSFYPFYYVEITDSQTVRTTSGMMSPTVSFYSMIAENKRLYLYRDSFIAQ